MCGITGYIGNGNAVEIAINNLKRLEYRGYDSAGVAYPDTASVSILRAPGKIVNLEALLSSSSENRQIAIAHTRWATHGRPCEANAHPHRDCTGQLAVVHNGIIENYAELRRELIAHGHEFTSDTDTEVLAHLIEEMCEQEKGCDKTEGVANAIRKALHRVKGSYAIAVISQNSPATVFVARKESPLIIRIGDGDNFIASDVSAVMRYTRNVLFLEDGDFATLSPSSITLTDLEGTPVHRDVVRITWDDSAAEKGGHAHFMIKEIYENPRTVRETMRGRLIGDGEIVLPDLPFTPDRWQKFRRISIVACGTAYHAGVVGKMFFEQILRRPVDVNVASEYRYSDPILDEDTLVVLISQSGETADTLAAMREAQHKGATTLAIVNVVGSTLARDADAVLLTQAGPEIGVASTKAYLAQLTALYLLGLYLARHDNTGNARLTETDYREYVAALRELPAQIETILKEEPAYALLAEELAKHHCFFFLGRRYDFAASLEAALKLKEISYIHAEAYPAGEMKHGPLALVEPGVAIVGFCTQPDTNEKMVSNLKEVKAREATIITVTLEGAETPDCSDFTLTVPVTKEAFMPLLSMVPMQLLAYHVARVLGCEIDQPRNLAKSVTVE
ncbi:glutamine--fructose-6-phosphate aminotransferase [isomerizing] [Armatimonadota bacterium]|nr:glutamine--fructose-6-phosphate aminotransferase [isomerizing] [Armatimonadota bacterium]